MAEGGGLLNRYTVNSRIVGSNPIPSANPQRRSDGYERQADLYHNLTHPRNANRSPPQLSAAAAVRYVMGMYARAG